MLGLLELRQQFDEGLNELAYTNGLAAAAEKQSGRFRRRLFYRAVAQYKRYLKSDQPWISFFDWILENADEILALIEKIIGIFLMNGDELNFDEPSNSVMAAKVAEMRAQQKQAVADKAKAHASAHKKTAAHKPSVKK